MIIGKILEWIIEEMVDEHLAKEAVIPRGWYMFIKKHYQTNPVSFFVGLLNQ